VERYRPIEEVWTRDARLDAVEDHAPPKGEHHFVVVGVETTFADAPACTGATEHVGLPRLNAVKIVEGR
jgi:hypothetical protein